MGSSQPGLRVENGGPCRAGRGVSAQGPRRHPEMHRRAWCSGAQPPAYMAADSMLEPSLPRRAALGSWWAWTGSLWTGHLPHCPFGEASPAPQRLLGSKQGGTSAGRSAFQP